MMLSGNLNNWPVTDLLQIMRVTQKTGALRIDGSRPGVIHFISGQIAGAAVVGQKAPTTVEEARRLTVDALHVLVNNSDGSFLVADPEVAENSTRWEVIEIMTEVDRLRMIESEIRREGINESSPLRLISGAPTPVTLHADDWEAIVALVPAFSVTSLEHDLGRSRALQVTATLISRGLAVPNEISIPVEPEHLQVSVSVATDPPVLDWLSEHPAEGDVDLSTDIPTSPRANDHDDDAVEVTAERRSLRSVVASPGTTLVSGVLNDMRKLRTNG
jgi:Domain of unknown function (DUF4388)